MRRLLYSLTILLAALAIAVYILAFWPLRNPHPELAPAKGTLAIQHAKIYPSPDTPAIDDGTILIRDGRIVAIGTAVDIPPGTPTVPCDHCIVTAGFWNTHVHFTESKWSFSDWKSRSTLNAQLADMLTSRGFTTVVDTGSDLRATIPLRRRIDTGDLLGPAIYTAGGAQYPPHGIPYYVRDTSPKYMQFFMAQPSSPTEAASTEERNIAQGADLPKLFTGSWIERGKVLPMPVNNATAAVEVAHRRHQLAFAHPSNLAGVQVAAASGVDVLAHAADETEGIDDALLHTLVDKHMTMIPTLKMFATAVTKNPHYLLPIYDEVHRFHTFGGHLMFGTDVGFMTDYTTEDEFTALQQSGLTAQDILRMLTTTPSELFDVASEKGTLTPGKLADLVVLASDPFTDVTAFAKARTTIRSGYILYQHP
jgi:imidazolonepropionase-like amidohydrolase